MVPAYERIDVFQLQASGCVYDLFDMGDVAVVSTCARGAEFKGIYLEKDLRSAGRVAA